MISVVKNLVYRQVNRDTSGHVKEKNQEDDVWVKAGLFLANVCVDIRPLHNGNMSYCPKLVCVAKLSVVHTGIIQVKCYILSNPVTMTIKVMLSALFL